MIIAALIIGIILLFFVWLLFYIGNRRDGKYEDGAVLGIIVATLLCLEGILLYFINNDSYPTAMNIYQGKTTLEITYIDSIPVGSVVVFKDRFKK